MQIKSNSTNQTLRLGQGIIDLSRPRVMGIINTTPDSFFEGSRYSGVDDSLRAAEKMILEGVDILDVGGYSSRPGAGEVSPEEELNRVIPVIEAICRSFPQIPVSIDTFRASIARVSLEAGACMVNDITAGAGDGEMFKEVSRHHAAMVLMHMRGTPATMGSLTNYDNITKEVNQFLLEQAKLAEAAGVTEIIFDPGFGFAKTVDQNFTLLRELEHFQILKKPILVGFSRKSMIWKTLKSDPSQALNGTTALNMAALMKGAKLLRVHDVKPAIESVELFCMIQNQSST